MPTRYPKGTVLDLESPVFGVSGRRVVDRAGRCSARYFQRERARARPTLRERRVNKHTNMAELSFTYSFMIIEFDKLTTTHYRQEYT